MPRVPIELDRDVSRGWLVARVTGDLTITDVVTFLKTARSSVETRAIPLLLDASAATTSMTAADVGARRCTSSDAPWPTRDCVRTSPLLRATTRSTGGRSSTKCGVPN
jgi:hypothetical protein